MAPTPEEVLAHYASEYYDPAKAREYYLRNRELKGRQSTKGMSDTQKEALGYSKHQIGEAKKSELTNTQKAMMARNQALREKAEEATKRITEKIRALASQLELSRANMSSAQLRKLQSGADSDKVQKLRESASKEINQIRTDLKAAIAKSRETYEENKKQISSKYDAAAEKEYNNIKSQLPGEAPKEPAKKRGRKKSDGTSKT